MEIIINQNALGMKNSRIDKKQFLCRQLHLYNDLLYLLCFIMNTRLSETVLIQSS